MYTACSPLAPRVAASRMSRSIRSPASLICSCMLCRTHKVHYSYYYAVWLHAHVFAGYRWHAFPRQINTSARSSSIFSKSIATLMSSEFSRSPISFVSATIFSLSASIFYLPEKKVAQLEFNQGEAATIYGGCDKG